MAQMGCFVPAEMAVIPVRDSLLSRIGTGDDMENNVSTFLMEMREVAQVRAVQCSACASVCVCAHVACIRGRYYCSTTRLCAMDGYPFCAGNDPIELNVSFARRHVLFIKSGKRFACDCMS